MRTMDRIPAASARGVGRALELGLVALQVVAFWLAVLLPAVYLPVLAAAGVGVVDPMPALSLVGLHLVALLVGHRHRSTTSTAGPQ